MPAAVNGAEPAFSSAQRDLRTSATVKLASVTLLLLERPMKIPAPLIGSTMFVQMRGDIKAIEGDMKEFKENQMYTNDGIFALCSVVKELVSGSQNQGQKSKANNAVNLLDKFLFRSRTLPMHRNAVRASLAGEPFQGLPWL